MPTPNVGPFLPAQVITYTIIFRATILARRRTPVVVRPYNIIGTYIEHNAVVITRTCKYCYVALCTNRSLSVRYVYTKEFCFDLHVGHGAISSLLYTLSRRTGRSAFNTRRMSLSIDFETTITRALQ